MIQAKPLDMERAREDDAKLRFPFSLSFVR